jgi:Helix-turn-helix domain
MGRGARSDLRRRIIPHLLTIRAAPRGARDTNDMPVIHTSELLTTAEAAELVQRAERSIRDAIAKQVLVGENKHGRWLIRREDLLAWDQKTGRRRRHRSSPWDVSAELLTEYGSLSATELAHLMGIHSGNARKYLAILAKQGRARRLPDGQWVPIVLDHPGAA